VEVALQGRGSPKREASKVVIHGLIAENVEDVVLEQEKAKKATRTQGSQAKSWLVGFLTGKGEVPSKQVVSAGSDAGHSRSAIYRAKDKLGDQLVVGNTPTVPKDPRGWSGTKMHNGQPDN
jgi:hypothetical protein